MSNQDKRQILIPIDESKHSLRAVDYYMSDIGEADRDYVHMLHIIEPKLSSLGVNVNTHGFTEELDKTIKDQIERAKITGHNFLERIKARNFHGKFTLHVGNRPEEHIVTLAKENSVDLIVIGNRGLGSIKRTVLGSVSDYVIHNACKPVAVVPPIIPSCDKKS